MINLKTNRPKMFSNKEGKQINKALTLYGKYIFLKQF